MGSTDGVDSVATLFKRGNNWCIQYFDHSGRRRTKSTRTSDNAAAKRIANKLEADAALRREAVIDPRQDVFAFHAQRKLSAHLDDYGAAQRGKSSAAHVSATRKFIEWICDDAGFLVLRDICPDPVNRYVAELIDDGKALRTVASYVQAIKGFTRWSVKTGKLPSDPLATISKPNPESDKRLVRRFLSHEEFTWIDAATRQSPTAYGMAGVERAMLYAMAIQTGLRSSELRSLTRGKLHLSANPPFVLVDSNQTKNSKPARQYIQPELASELRSHVSKKTAGASVFNMPAGWDVAEMLRADMAAARAKWLEPFKGQEQIEADGSDFLRPIDSQGETLDFHALRHTCASWLIQAGADVMTVKSVMRHCDIKLTLDRYGHLYPGSEAAAVAMVRSAFVRPIASEATGTGGGALHICGQSGCETVRDSAESCDSGSTSQGGEKPHKPLENAENQPISQEKNAVRVLGLEPRTHGLKVRSAFDVNSDSVATCENPQSGALHICGQSGPESQVATPFEPVRKGAEGSTSERMLRLFFRMTEEEQQAELLRWQSLYGSKVHS